MKSISNPKDDLIVGAGGGDAPAAAQDNLLSEDFFEVVLALGEGEIKGLVSPESGAGAAEMWQLANIFAGDTPLYNLSAGEMNFKDFSAVVRNGNAADPPFDLKLGGEASNLAVNTNLGSNVAVTRRTPASARNVTDCLEVRILMQQLFTAEGGGTSDGTAQFRISYKRASSGTWIDYQGQASISVTGKTTAGYVREFSIPVARVNEDYDVRVIKLSPDAVPGADGLTVQASWESMQMIKYGNVSHSRLAMLHLYGKATNQFSSIPEFSLILDGLILDIPSNYNPDARTYVETPPWNLVTKKGYTDNPPWVLYNLITNPDWGLAHYFKGVTANKADFYTEGKWCDELVPDGAGGTRPRFRFSMNLTEAKPGMELIRYVAGTFNAVVLDDGNGVLTIRTDRPRTGGQIFSPENVQNGEFTYSFTDLVTRYNDVGVSFVNPDLNWEADYRKASVDTTAYIEKNGRIEFNFEALGCTNVHEAICRANYRVITANKEKTSVSFITSRFGLVTNLLDQILVADPLSGWSTGGRVKSVAGATIQLRDPIYFPTTAARVMRVQTNSGITVLNVQPPSVGTVYSLSIVSGSWPADAPARTVFTIEDNQTLGLAKPFRVLALEEVEGRPDVVQITALEVYENKYSDAENGVIGADTQYSYRTPGGALLPLSVAFSTPAPTVAPDGTLMFSIEAEIVRQANSNANKFEFHYRRLGDSAWMLRETYSNSILLNPVVSGKSYEIRVYAVSPIGVRSRNYLAMNYVVGSNTVQPPETVTGLVATTADGQGVIRWDAALAADYKHTEIRIGGPSSTATTAPVYGIISGNRMPWVPWPAAGTYNIFARHFNRSDKPSTISEAITATVTATTITSGPSGTNLVQNSKFLQLRSSMPYPYDPQGWAAYGVNFTIENNWAWEDRPGRDGGPSRSIALRAVKQTVAGTAGGRFGFMTSQSIVDKVSTGGISRGWQPGETYTVSLWARVWQPGNGGAAGSTVEATTSMVGSNTGAFSNGASVTVANIAGVQAGDVLIVAFNMDEYNVASVSSPGWTVMGTKSGREANLPNGSMCVLLYRFLDAASAQLAGFTFTLTGTSYATNGMYITTALRGMSATNFIQSSSGWATKAAANQDFPVTPSFNTTGNTVLLWFAALDTTGGGDNSVTYNVQSPLQLVLPSATLAAANANTQTPTFMALSNGGAKSANGTVPVITSAINSINVNFGYDAICFALNPGSTSSAAPNVATGLWLNGAAQHEGDRSYMLARISRTTGAVTFSRTYDVWGIGSAGTGAGFSAANLAADLNATNSDSIVVVWTRDSPSLNRLTAGLPAALYRCGASPAIFGAVTAAGGDLWTERCAYQLIGIPGIGAGEGFERYKGAIASDPTAIIDTRFDLEGPAGLLMPVVRETGAHRVLSSGFGLTVPAVPAKSVTAWQGKQTNLYWNHRPVFFEKVEAPGISNVWQQFKYRFTWGTVTEASGNLYWGIGDETGATVLDSLPLGSVVEMSEPMVSIGPDFSPHEPAPQDEIQERSLGTALLAQNSTYDTNDYVTSGPWTTPGATQVLQFDVYPEFAGDLVFTIMADGRIVSLSGRPSSAL